MAGKAIELFLVDGVSAGITTAEISGWTGKVIRFERGDLSRFQQREEAQRNGVYFLLAHDPECIENTWCYIGSTENLGNRLTTHNQRKDNWQRAVVVCNWHESFNQAHWGELEARLLAKAREAERCSLSDNLQTPKGRRLSEAQAATVEAFLAELAVILPVLGVNVLRSATVASKPNATESLSISPIFEIRSRTGVDAKMQLVGDELFLLQGSRVVAEWRGKGKTEATKRGYAALSNLHSKLVADGSIANGVVQRNILCASPSQAGSLALGTSCNGRTRWATAEGITFGEWLTGQN